MTPSWKSLQNLCEEKIREGQAQQARKILESLDIRRIPRDHAAPFAALARRSNLPMLGLRILRSWVRGSERSPVRAAPGEKAEYAACLLRIGATTEAQELLDEVRAADAPESLLFGAFARFKRWEYEESIPLLESYASRADVGEYQKLVARTNLASCLVFAGRTRQARALLRSLLRETRDGGHRLLHGNALEYLAQAAIADRDWAAADACLARSHARLQGSGTLDELFVRKWRAVADLLREPRSEEGRQALLSVRAEALRIGHGETLRDCDQYLAISSGDTGLYRHLHFGTPYPSFRRKLAERFGSPELTERYLWKPGSDPVALPRPGDWVLDIGSPPEGAHAIKPGQLLQRLLAALALDFYQAPRLAALHALIFPGAHYDPRSSPARVHQAIKRLRAAMLDGAWPLRIQEERGSYRLIASGEMRIAVERPRPGCGVLGDTRACRLQSLRSAMGDREFTASEAARALGIASRVFQRLASEAGGLVRSGAARSTRYRFG
jgi:hypothetical protein